MESIEEPRSDEPDTAATRPARLVAGYARRTWSIATLLVVAAAAVVWLMGGLFESGVDLFGSSSDRAWVDLTEPESHRPGGMPDAGEPVLRVAIAPVISPEKSLEMYQGFVDYLSRALGREPAFLRRASYAEVNDLVRHGLCDVAFVCTYAYVRGEREFGMELLVIPEIDGSITYNSYIIVSRDDPASSLLDLRGRSFASADIMSNTGWLFPYTWLREKGEEFKSFFSQSLITGSHDRSVLAVANGLADGAAVDSIVYEHMVADDPSIGGTTKVILRSPGYGMPPLVVPVELDASLKAELRLELLGMHEEPEGRLILDELRITRFRVPDPSLYDAVRTASDSLEGR